MLFPIVYEEKMQIEVDFQTIERIFYILLSLEYLYIEMENNHDGIVNKF